MMIVQQCSIKQGDFVTLVIIEKTLSSQ